MHVHLLVPTPTRHLRKSSQVRGHRKRGPDADCAEGASAHPRARAPPLRGGRGGHGAEAGVTRPPQSSPVRSDSPAGAVTLLSEAWAPWVCRSAAVARAPPGNTRPHPCKRAAQRSVSQVDVAVLTFLESTALDRNPERQEQICLKILAVACKQVQRDL